PAVTLCCGKPSKSGRLDSNQRPPEPHSVGTPLQIATESKDTASSDCVCTRVCTSNQENANATTLDQLAAALLNLSVDRARLAAMLIAGQGEGKADSDL